MIKELKATPIFRDGHFCPVPETSTVTLLLSIEFTYSFCRNHQKYLFEI